MFPSDATVSTKVTCFIYDPGIQITMYLFLLKLMISGEQCQKRKKLPLPCPNKGKGYRSILRILYHIQCMKDEGYSQVVKLLTA